MNIENPEQCIGAWEQELQNVDANAAIPEHDRDRVGQGIDDEYAPIYDAVTAYFNARFLRVC